MAEVTKIDVMAAELDMARAEVARLFALLNRVEDAMGATGYDTAVRRVENLMVSIRQDRALAPGDKGGSDE